MTVLRAARALSIGRPATLLLLAAFLLSPSFLAPSAAFRAPTPAPQHALFAVRPLASTCTNLVSKSFTGSLVEYGNLSPIPPVGHVIVNVNYEVLTKVVYATGGSQSTCGPAQIGATTDSTGGFSLSITLPPNSCTARQCTYYSGPFAPLSYALANGTPSGYFVDGNFSGMTLHVGVVEAFGTLTISPGGPRVVSVGAPTRFAAHPLAADGTPSPVPFTYAWSVDTGGWTLSPSATNATINLTGQAGASPTLLHLAANGSYQAIPFSGQIAVSVAAVATSLSIAQAVPTSVDVGMPVAFSATGAGAGGYSYAVSVTPGLGEPTQNSSCAATPIQGGEVSLSCAVHFAYDRAGVAAPGLTVTNGYSSAARTLPSVSIARTLLIRLSPSPLATYTDRPLVVTATIVNGTGTSPFGPACLHPGNSGPICLNSPGPSWTYAVAYPVAGVYPALEIVQDAAGANATLSENVTVAGRPSLAPISASTQVIEVGGTVTLLTDLLGGVGPIHYWWNESLPNTTLAPGLVPANGLLSETLQPTAAGHDTIVLTCVDALGSRVAASVSLTVEPGPAVGIALASGASPPASGVAGVPISLSLDGLAPSGGRVPDYASSLTIRVAAPSPLARVWINSSIAGSFASVAGAFAIPVNAWYAGYLNLTLLGVLEGRYTVSVVAQLPVEFGAAGTFPISIGPNAERLILFDPVVAMTAPRAGSTEYRISDVFANPASPGWILVEEEFGATPTVVKEPILLSGNLSQVWVNWSAPSSSAGSVIVVAAAGEQLLAPIEVAAAVSAGDPTLGLTVGSLLGIAVVGTGLLLIRRGGSRRPGTAGMVDPAEATEQELRRGAEGRERLLERIRREGPLGLEGLRTGWPDPGPTSAELAEWLAGLVTEGAVVSEMGRGGEVVYRVRTEVPAGGSGDRPRIQVDPIALERALSAMERPEGSSTEPPKN